MNASLMKIKRILSKSMVFLALIICCFSYHHYFILALTMTDVECYSSENVNYDQPIMNELNIKCLFYPFTYFLCGNLKRFAWIKWLSVISIAVKQDLVIIFIFGFYFCVTLLYFIFYCFVFRVVCNSMHFIFNFALLFLELRNKYLLCGQFEICWFVRFYFLEFHLFECVMTNKQLSVIS